MPIKVEQRNRVNANSTFIEMLRVCFSNVYYNGGVCALNASLLFVDNRQKSKVNLKQLDRNQSALNPANYITHSKWAQFWLALNFVSFTILQKMLKAFQTVLNPTELKMYVVWRKRSINWIFQSRLTFFFFVVIRFLIRKHCCRSTTILLLLRCYF